MFGTGPVSGQSPLLSRTGLVQHYIDINHTAPIRLRPNRLPLAKCQTAKELIQNMVANGIIEPSKKSLVCAYSYGPEEKQGVALL